MGLGEALLEERERRGLSQYKAADQLETTRLTYRLWEMGAVFPSLEKLPSVMGWLGVSANELMEMAGLPAFAEGTARCRCCEGTGRETSG